MIRRVRESVRTLTRWMLVIPAVFLILLGCGQAGIVSAKIPSSADTRSRLRADYSPWPFFVVKPLNPAVYEVIQADVGDEMALASPVAGDFWATPSATATVGKATSTPSVTVSPSSQPLGSVTAAETASGVPAGTLGPTATPSHTPVAPSTGSANATATRTNTALPTATRTNTPMPTATRTRTSPPPVTGPSGTHYRSIGVNSGTLYAAGNASISQGSTTVSFGGGASLPAPDGTGAVGSGDRLVIGGETFFILSRDSATRVTVQTAAGATHTNEAYSIRRAYNTFQAWEDPCGATPCLPTSGGGRGGNLVGEDRIEVGVAYKDGLFTTSGNAVLVFDGSATDANHYMSLTVPPGQRHNGIEGSGVVLDGQDATKHGVRIFDDYARVAWIELKRFRSENGASGVEVNNSKNAELDGLLIHDYDSGAYSAMGINHVGASSATVRNCVIYAGDSAGVRVNAGSSAVIQNCSIYGMMVNGVWEDGGTAHVTNTISMGNGNNDFLIINGSQANNLSEDGTAACGTCLSGRVPADQFVSIGAGSENLHLKGGSGAVDAGANLSAQFDDDVDQEARPQGAAWDVGADEWR